MSDTPTSYTIWQAVSAAFAISLKAIEEVRALARQPGPKGEPGPPGKLPMVREWMRGIHYEGVVVTHDGSAYQAKRDTAEEPPHNDWQLIAGRGADGLSIDPRGKWEPDEEYRVGSVVGWDGTIWLAKRGNPGEPGNGDGWMAVPRAKPGRPGEPGKRGEPGKDGRDGASLIAIQPTGNGPEMVGLLDNGETIPIDMEPVLRWYHDMVTR